MNKCRNIIALAILTMISALGASGYSQENQTDPENIQPELKWLYGNVAQVAFAKGFIVVFSDQGYTTFAVTDKTIISIGPKKVGLEAIKTEDSVRVQYYCTEPKKCVAVSISESKKENE